MTSVNQIKVASFPKVVAGALLGGAIVACLIHWIIMGSNWVTCFTFGALIAYMIIGAKILWLRAPSSFSLSRRFMGVGLLGAGFTMAAWITLKVDLAIVPADSKGQVEALMQYTLIFGSMIGGALTTHGIRIRSEIYNRDL